MERIKKIEEDLRESELQGNSSKTTILRGRLINKIKIEIEKLRKSNHHEDVNKLKELEIILSNILASNSVKKLRNEQSASTIIAFSNSSAITIKKVGICGYSLVRARNNKEDIINTYELLKTTRLLSALPDIFTATFLVKQWYLLMILSSYVAETNGNLVKKMEDEIETKTENIKTEIIINNEIKEIKEDEKDVDEEHMKNRIVARNITNVNSFKEAYNLIRNNFRAIDYLIKSNDQITEENLDTNIKERIKYLQEKFSKFNPHSPNSKKELNMINKGLEEIKMVILRNSVVTSNRHL